MTDNKPGNKKRLILSMMFILFAGPFLVSWWLFTFTDMGKGGDSINHGELVLPPRQLGNIDLVEHGGQTTHPLHGKWNLIFLVNEDCDESCDQMLYVMRQVRLAMNNNAHRLQRVLISGQGANPILNAKQVEDYPGQLTFSVTESNELDFIEMFSNKDNPYLAGRLYLVDPLGNLMMFYSRESDPAGIIKDLKRLLRYSRIG
jgi:cytochrome oxidase Cu insertion factor (SCO1/SenC/PrrC family)